MAIKFGGLALQLRGGVSMAPSQATLTFPTIILWAFASRVGHVQGGLLHSAPMRGHLQLRPSRRQRHRCLPAVASLQRIDAVPV